MQLLLKSRLRVSEIDKLAMLNGTTDKNYIICFWILE